MSSWSSRLPLRAQQRVHTAGVVLQVWLLVSLGSGVVVALDAIGHAWGYDGWWRAVRIAWTLGSLALVPVGWSWWRQRRSDARWARAREHLDPTETPLGPPPRTAGWHTLYWTAVGSCLFSLLLVAVAILDTDWSLLLMSLVMAVASLGAAIWADDRTDAGWRQLCEERGWTYLPTSALVADELTGVRLIGPHVDGEAFHVVETELAGCALRVASYLWWTGRGTYATPMVSTVAVLERPRPTVRGATGRLAGPAGRDLHWEETGETLVVMGAGALAVTDVQPLIDAVAELVATSTPQTG